MKVSLCENIVKRQPSASQADVVGHVGIACLCECLPLIKILDTKAWLSFSGWQHFHILPYIITERIKYAHVILLGEDNWKPAPVFSGYCPCSCSLT